MDGSLPNVDPGTAWSLYATDRGAADLKAQARAQTPQSQEAVARQFEALFLQMMLQSMRQASLADGILDNDDSKYYQQLFDQKVAQSLTARGGIGLAPAIARQLSTLVAADAAAAHVEDGAPRLQSGGDSPNRTDSGANYSSKSIKSYLQNIY